MTLLPPPHKLKLLLVVINEAAVEFLWWVGWGLQSHFHVQPNNCVEVVLRCVVVGVLTILGQEKLFGQKKFGLSTSSSVVK